MMNQEQCYGPIKEITLDRFKIARYVIISPSPEWDVMEHMDRWAQCSGLLEYPGYEPKKIGWDFPFVSKEQQEKFGMRGYVAAYVIPEEFVPACDGAELAYVETDTYATLTITDPHSNSFEKIPVGFQLLLDYAKPASWDNRVAFEEEYDVDGVHYMDIYVPMN